MNRFVGVGLVAAAVVVVALVGYSLLPSRGGTGAPAPSATPTPVAPLPSESLPAGSFTVTNASFTLVPYTFTVPAGWIRDDGGALRGDDSLGELLMASTPTPVTVGGLQGVRLDLELAPRAESRPEGCPVQTCVSVFRGKDPAPLPSWTWDWAIASGEQARVYLLTSSDGVLAIIVDSLDGTTMPSLSHDADDILASVHFE
jgi:hypothetical protein